LFWQEPLSAAATIKEEPMTPKPVVFCIDVEPESRTATRADRTQWDSFEEFRRVIDSMRNRLTAATGAAPHFNWFLRLDPQIERMFGSTGWPVHQFRMQLSQLEKLGDEIGLHSHAFRWDDATGSWFTDHGDQQWVSYCVEQGLKAFSSGFGRTPRCFRFGDRWMSNATVELLESYGVLCDLTIEPGNPQQPQIRDYEQATGCLPDYRTTPLFPYQPTHEDFRVAASTAGRSIWLAPVSVAALGVDSFATCNLGLPPSHVIPVIDKALQEYPLLVIAARTGDYPLLREHYQANLEYLLSHPQLNSSEFVTAPAALKLLNETPGSTMPPQDATPGPVTLASDLRPPPRLEFDAGFYAEEGDFRWMKTQGSISVAPANLPATLKLEISRADANLYASLPVKVSIQISNAATQTAATQTVVLTKKKHCETIAIPLPASPRPVCVALQSNTAFKPSEHAATSDSRTLSVIVRNASLTPG